MKAKIKKSDDQTNNKKYRVAKNIRENHIISKCMMINHLFHVKINVKMSKMDAWTFWSQ